MNSRDGIGGCSSIEVAGFVFLVERCFLTDFFLREGFFLAMGCLSSCTAVYCQRANRTLISPSLVSLLKLDRRRLLSEPTAISNSRRVIDYYPTILT